MNIDEKLIEELITPRTKAIYCVDYGGVRAKCAINEIAARHGLFVIEDAAQAIGSTYKGKYAVHCRNLAATHSMKQKIMSWVKVEQLS